MISTNLGRIRTDIRQAYHAILLFHTVVLCLLGIEHESLVNGLTTVGWFAGFMEADENDCTRGIGMTYSSAFTLAS